MSKSLGRGLSSLIKNNQQTPGVPAQKASWLEQGNQEVLSIAPDKITANPYQPRHHFAEDSLDDLKQSISEHGILQPLTVTRGIEGKYELVAGERRLRAARAIGLTTVPVIVRTAGELEKLELSLIENIQRQDLNPIERARAYRKLVDDFSMTHEQVAKKLGKSRPVISNHLRLLELPKEVVSLVERNKLSETLAIAVLEIGDPEKQKAFAREIVEKNLTKREAKRFIRQSSSRKSNTARTKKDPELRAYEEQLQTKLATRVAIGRQGASGWVIEIEAYSREELSSIVDKIVK